MQSFICKNICFQLINNYLLYLIYTYLEYLPGSKERKEIEAELKRLSNNVEDVPIIIGNEKFKTKDVRYQVMVRQSLYINIYLLYTYLCI